MHYSLKLSSLVHAETKAAKKHLFLKVLHLEIRDKVDPIKTPGNIHCQICYPNFQIYIRYVAVFPLLMSSLFLHYSRFISISVM